MAQEQEAAKPFYGPPMNRAIFATKWLAKFEDFLVHKRHEPPLPDELRICTLPEAGFDLLSNFHEEATALHISSGDFPKEVSSISVTVGNNGRVPVDGLGIAKVNPFHGEKAVLYLLDQLTECLMKVKARGHAVEGKRWQNIPLSWRQRINDLLMRVEEAREEGWWIFPNLDKMEEIEKKVMASIAKEKEKQKEEEKEKDANAGLRLRSST
ncbi:hypothetical protein PRZ48_011206 [Zasmidium cellare]|uniref:Uncharacterized protein n=1 Tax=Zasmidium cellare TaxID=395010 RepID=A0ABR0EBX2_ZASCE|nr:hypothetical protein PRZ48_011206 [Zasmidium cellare]